MNFTQHGNKSSSADIIALTTSAKLRIRPSFNAQSCPAADNCWHESLIYPHIIHEVSRTLGNLSHKTGLWLGLFNTASVKWLKVNNIPVRSERNCSCSCSNCCCIYCKLDRRVRQHSSGWNMFCSRKMVIGKFCTEQRERCLSCYDSVSLQPRNQKWFNGAFSCPMRKIRTIFS